MTAFQKLAPHPVQRSSELQLGMAQLALRGLSEDWCLKHFGDLHWQLIAEASGQSTPVFRDARGRQLYAAFCATEFRQTPPNLACLGASLRARSELWAVGRSRLQSDHRLMLGDQQVARLRMVSTFVTHERPGSNASICRAMPSLMPELPQADDGFATQAANAARALRGTVTAPPALTITPSPGTDFNAVGLLYFPSFSRFFEDAESRLETKMPWRPVARRRVLYFGNIELGDPLGISRAPAQSGHAAYALLNRNQQKIAYCEVQRALSCC